MEFDNSFEVPVAVDQAWALLNDIERIAPCFPGAELTEVVDADTFKGKVSVRLGPVALAFVGQASFQERDAAAHSARVKAQGNDSKGRGGANADVVFSMAPVDGGGTSVTIHTKLQLSGAVAQYGRGVGMVADLSQQLIGQFAESLRVQLAGAEAAEPGGAAGAQGAPAPAPSAAKPVPVLGLGMGVVWRAFLRWLRGLFGASS